jgi:hypothetical protein
MNRQMFLESNEAHCNIAWMAITPCSWCQNNYVKFTVYFIVLVPKHHRYIIDERDLQIQLSKAAKIILKKTQYLRRQQRPCQI